MGDTCGGECDGTNGIECRYPSATTTCAQVCSAGQQTLSSCDGLGECVQGATTTCAGYSCEGDVCRTSCTVNDECTAGYHCVNAACVPRTCQASAECPAGLVCNPESNVCEAPRKVSGEDSGCGCRVAGESRSSTSVWLVALAALAVAFVCRRRVQQAAGR